MTYAGNLENLKDFEGNPHYSFEKGDVTDKVFVENLFASEKFDLVVHFAAESHVDRSVLSSEDFIKTNIEGTQILLDAAKDNGNVRFHHISTDEVFGALGLEDEPFKENTPYDPRSPYSASKAASDHLVRAYFHTHELPITISNCSNNYGPYQFPEKLIPLFVTNILENKKVPVYGSGENIRDWIHVDDHNRGVEEIIKKGKIGETYCLGGGNEKTNMEITKLILELMGKGDEMIEYVKDRPGHDKRYAINFSKIKKELNWSPQISFEDGLKETVEWYKKNEDWWKRIKSGEYQDYYKEQYGSGGGTKKVLIIGAKGMLGQELVRCFSAEEKFEVLAWDRDDVDITDEVQLEKKIVSENPDVIINAAAYNAVDKAEEDEKEFALAKKMNAEAPKKLAQIAKKIDATFVQYVTDYLFDGKRGEYAEDAEVSPISNYGISKAMGEKNVQEVGGKFYLIRISKLFGKPAKSESAKKSFFDVMLKLAEEKDELQVVDGEKSCFTYVPDLAQATKNLLEGDYEYGIYHLINEGAVTWYEGLVVLFELAGIENVKLRPVGVDAFPRPAKRADSTVLVNTKFPKLRGYEEAIKDWLKNR